jgi:hypothetical protein
VGCFGCPLSTVPASVARQELPLSRITSSSSRLISCFFEEPPPRGMKVIRHACPFRRYKSHRRPRSLPRVSMISHQPLPVSCLALAPRDTTSATTFHTPHPRHSSIPIMTRLPRLGFAKQLVVKKPDDLDQSLSILATQSNRELTEGEE